MVVNNLDKHYIIPSGRVWRDISSLPKAVLCKLKQQRDHMLSHTRKRTTSALCGPDVLVLVKWVLHTYLQHG